MGSAHRCWTSLRTDNLDYHDLTGLHEVDGRRNPSNCSPDHRPVIRIQYDERQLASKHFLLIANVLVASKQNVEARRFRGLQQSPVEKTLPTRLIRSLHSVPTQEPRQGRRHISVE